MADLAKARTALDAALKACGCNQARHLVDECDRCKRVREALAALPAEPNDVAPLAVLSDYLKEQGMHDLLSVAEDPVKELFGLREQRWRALELIEGGPHTGLRAPYSACIRFEGLEVYEDANSRSAALERALRQLAYFLNRRAMGLPPNPDIDGADLAVARPRPGVDWSARFIATDGQGNELELPPMPQVAGGVVQVPENARFMSLRFNVRDEQPAPFSVLIDPAAPAAAAAPIADMAVEDPRRMVFEAGRRSGKSATLQRLAEEAARRGQSVAFASALSALRDPPPPETIIAEHQFDPEEIRRGAYKAMGLKTPRAPRRPPAAKPASKAPRRRQRKQRR